MNRGARQATVYRVAKSRTRLSDFHSFQYSCLENPLDKETGGLQSIGPQRAGHN